MKQFNIETEFQGYCKRIGLDLDLCPPDQIVEMRRAFYAGVGSWLMFCLYEIDDTTSDDAAASELERIYNEVRSFFARQAGLTNEN